MNVTSTLRSGALIATAIVGLAGTAHAETYKMTMGSSHPPIFPWVGALSTEVVGRSNQMLEEMGSEDRIEWTESYGGALYGFQDTLEGVSDGLADAGWVGTFWEESKMPLQNVTYYTPFTIDDLTLLAKIIDDLNDDFPEMEAAWDKQNLVVLGTATADTYQMFSKFPINTLADLEGHKVLAPGPAGAWFPPVGATPVNGGLPTYYNQLSTGVADAAVTLTTGYFPNKLYEVAPYVTIVNMGASYIGGFAVNKDTWEGLSDDVQKVLRELGKEYSRVNAERVEANYTKFMDLLKQNPDVTVSVLPAAERQAWIDKLPGLAGEWAKTDPAAPKLLTSYMEAVRAAGITPSRDWDKE